MSVTAKFFVQKRTEYAHNQGAAEISLSAVSRGEENKTWAKYTPSGTIIMTVNNETAAEQFILGKEYLITFEPVD